MIKPEKTMKRLACKIVIFLQRFTKSLFSFQFFENFGVLIVRCYPILDIIKAPIPENHITKTQKIHYEKNISFSQLHHLSTHN